MDTPKNYTFLESLARACHQAVKFFFCGQSKILWWVTVENDLLAWNRDFAEIFRIGREDLGKYCVKIFLYFNFRQKRYSQSKIQKNAKNRRKRLFWKIMGQVVHILSFFITKVVENWSHSKTRWKLSKMMVIFAVDVWNIFLLTIYARKREIGKTARKFFSFVQILRLVL